MKTVFNPLFDFRESKDEAKSSEVESSDKSNESKHTTEESVSRVLSPDENEGSKTIESQSQTKLSSSITKDESLPSESTIRAKEHDKNSPERLKRNITSPLSVEVCFL